MDHVFKQLETDFQVFTATPSTLVFSIEAEELVRGEALDPLLTLLTKQMQLQTPAAVNASLLSKNYAHFLIAGLSMISNWNLGVSFHPTNLLFGADGEGRFLMIVKDAIATPAHSDRTTWRSSGMKELYAHHLTPLFHEMNRRYRVPLPTLWENAYGYIDAYYRKWIAEAPTSSDKERLASDFRFLLKEADPEIFGTTKNPFTIFEEDNIERTDEGLPIRKTCCLYYKVADQCCRNCPRVYGKEDPYPLTSH
ncbi:IucA/IucC family C-terminal-domain containing protein [Mechercharimyces sp. CAU 1602]|uniref:IucA/IucC family C-terminal-domain containing protein n=1 Tax=Mechercharimyces sp. CAU 1602 TaxID=2973933 RepID=UPI002161542E|nr:IucA/IucC family C-terminal-domain containing protein [Mechercharimyces sp. CAU 1602]MCS1352735.1 hypothetical protein [Mechercharimyces sp. CAU 1602]